MSRKHLALSAQGLSPAFPAVLGILAIAISLLLAPLHASAASFRTWIAQIPAAPASSDTVRVWMNSDTAFGESAGLQYQVNGNYIKVLGGYDDASQPGANWYADIPAQPNGTLVQYQLFTRNEFGTDYGFTGFNWSYTVSDGGPVILTDARALWLDQDVIAWNGVAGASYKLLYDPDGAIDAAVAGATAYSTPAVPGFVSLTPNGTIVGADFPKNPNANGLARLDLPGTISAMDAKNLLTGQIAVAAYDGGGALVAITGVQIQGVLDDLYVDNGTADSALLGVTYSAGAPTVALWAPTAKNVTLKRYADSTTSTATDHAMTLDPASGVWSVTGDAAWDRDFYLFDVQVYVAETDAVENNLVTDPYAVSLSTNSLRSQFVNLDDADLKPAGWDSLSKPPLAQPEDIAVYEVHVRDFSRDDATVPAGDRGKFNAFSATASDAMTHLLALKDAGLTHVHLLPVFDIASVNEDASARTDPNPTGFGRAGEEQQSAVGAHRTNDSFNWGYDPFHFGVPEGSYSTDPDGVQRILEFREMVQSLNENDLRLVMDVVYNHTNSAGQSDPQSVFDRIVPGYYYRYTLDGTLEQSSCCPDTASEYAMFDKLMRETLVRWAVAYKVDGFRFDLMNLHTVQNAVDARDAVQAIDPDIYVYGEGWDFGSAAAKGLTACPNCYAKQANMTGTGIGTFNDKIRDAAHGGYSTDSLQIRKQGFINGLSYDWNGFTYNNRDQSNLHAAMNTLRSALRGSGTDWNGAGSPYTDDPQESVPYVSKHDNETLFDQNVFKLPNGEGGVPVTSLADRVRVQNMGHSLVGLSQGVPFFHMGADILRSKSLDRNSYDSGDWFNRVDWSYGDGAFSNNFGQGLPPAWDNSTRWGIMTPLLTNTALDPAAADAAFAAGHLREILRIRNSSPLFRLPTEADVNARVSFFNGDNAVDGLIVMGLSDEPAPDLDGSYETILVFFNANKVTQNFVIAGADGFTLHPIQADGTDADPVVQGAAFDDGTDTFTIPPRTTAVFVSTQLITPPAPPSNIDWVGDMFPAGAGEPVSVIEGDSAGQTVYIQVYEPGVTDSPGQGAGIECFVHWGRYGEAWQDLAMTYNVDIGNNDEYQATIPTAGLTPGSYGFTAYCTDDGGVSKKWRDGSDGILTVIPAADSVAPSPAGGVFVHLFEWTWPDIEKECSYLAQKGYSAVQVSPPMEHVVPVENMGDPPVADYPWWVRYQPVTHDAAKLTSRSGTPAEFQSMVTACTGLGVEIYVDAVINHTTGVGSGTGTAGSSYTEYDYPQYDPGDFHMCGTADNEIINYSNRFEVQNCELVNLADLDTSQSDVQDTLRAYMQGLLDMGVTGFRLDASKHMPAHEIHAILDGLTLPGGGAPYIFQEVIDQGGEPVKSFEYTPNGDVTEFRYSVDLGGTLNNGGTLAALQNFTSGFLASDFAVIFTDNHDNQRGHGAGGSFVLDHRDGNDLYDLGNVFMLAYPYGYPKVMSSYYWSDNPASDVGDSKGPPSATDPYLSGSGPDTRPVYGAGQVAGDEPANCSAIYEDGKWVCEHRRTAMANMVAFRAVTAGEAVTNWWDDGGNHIAFGRGDKGFVALNRTASPTTQSYQTDLPAGSYCNITEYDYANGQCVDPTTGAPAPASALIVVDSSGQIINQGLPVLGTLAIHVAARVVESIQVTPASVGVVPSGSTDVVARISPPLAGITIDFVLSGGGALATAGATTDVNGEARVQYNAPAAAAIAQVAGTVSGTSLTDSALVYVATLLISEVQEPAVNDPHTTGTLATHGVSIVKNGSGQPRVGVAQFSGDPCPTSIADVGTGAVSPFVDVLLEDTTDVTSLDITLKYTDETEEATHTLYWCNATGQWTAVSGGTVTLDTGANTLSFAVTDATAPSLSDLEGTPLVGFNGVPLAVSLGYFHAARLGENVRFTWQTATESGVAGFHLLAEERTEEGATLRQLTTNLIPSTAVDSVTPRDYQLTIRTVAERFYLSEVGIDGGVTRHGPYELGVEYGVYTPAAGENRGAIFLPLIQR